MLLFGGHDAKQSVVEIDENNFTAKIIGKLQIGKWKHRSEKIGNFAFILGDMYNNKIEKYDLKSNTSEIISLQMSPNNDDYSSVTYLNQIYVIGGFSDDLRASIDTVEYFEPEKMTWIQAPKLLKGVRCHDSIISDGVIYVIGDVCSNKFQRFDPREGKWTYLSDIPTNTYYSAVTSFNQTITCAGNSDNCNNKKLCQIYDIRNNTWSTIANLPRSVKGANSFENDVSLVVSGGECDFIQKYDKKSKTWSILNVHLPVPNAYSSKIVM